MKKNVLIMGGNGFIGKNVSEYLTNKKINIEIYDLNKNPKYKTYIGNIEKDNNLEKIISKFDSIIYLVNPNYNYNEINNSDICYKEIDLLTKVLENCIKTKCNQVIFASSGGTIYGNTIKPAEEDNTLCNPISHHGISKLTCEKILLSYNELYGMNNIILRIANPYGIGQNPDSNIGVITKFTYKVLDNKEVELYGNTTRDFININKVSEIFYKTLIWKFNPEITPIFNVGSGKGISIKEILELISKTLDKDINIKYLDKRNYEIDKSILDMRKTKKYLNISLDKDEIENIKKYIIEIKDQV